MSTPDDIAVIGLGCRFPGATCLGEFWDVLSRGENHVTDIPPDRWNADTFHDSNLDAVGKSYSRRGGFIKNYAHFDNKLFGINESEAAQMDPQQRQVLECTYMALENAGITRQQIAGQKVGVYIGAMNSDFTVRMTANSHKIDNYSVAGLAGSVIANRLSYVYNLCGPSMVIDTACSSSLVAIHQAGLALRSGDCNMAICGGINLMLHPTVFVPLSKARMLSPTGQCHAFSAAADGYTRGEGCGIVILKPLREALKDGDNIWGTIMTGVNQDGRAAQPITAPAGNQQMELLTKVYTSYRTDPSSVEYIEAHGTGTKLGDPVEVKAFGEFFAAHGQPRQRYIGTVKTNIGHLEPAAGVAGLIKVLLMMKHNTIVPSLHFDKPNELIDFDKYMFHVPTESVPWASVNKVACINSFGFGGTNSHAIVRQYNKKAVQRNNHSFASQIVCFSGSNDMALKESIQVFLSHDLSNYTLQAISHTSTTHREHFAFRKAFVANSIQDLRKQTEEAVGKGINNTTHFRKLNIVFVFCGMGTAWNGMCNILMDKYSVVRSTLGAIETYLHSYVSWSLIKRLREGHDVDDPKFGPIAIFACQVALVRLWESFGVKPDVVVGQSVGEVAAAHIAGILSLGDAVRVIYHRTRILAKVTGGKMLLIRNTDTQTVQRLCDDIGNTEVALFYSPVTCTVSGETSAVDKLKGHFEKLKEKEKTLSMTELQVTSAFHSLFMDPCQKQLDIALAGLKSSPSNTTIISTIDTDLSHEELMLPDYWGKNVRKPVQFFDAIKKSIVSDALNIFIEIGPRPVLGSHLEDIFNTNKFAVMALPSLSAKVKDLSLLKSLSVLYEHKFDIKWQGMFTNVEPLTPVPCYVFSHKHLIILPVITEEEVFGAQSNHGDHLFVKHSSSKCKLSITPSAFATVYEHKVQGILVVPGATYAEAGFGIGKALNLRGTGHLIVSVRFFSPVTLKKDCPVNLDLDVENTDANVARFFVRQGEVIHAQGDISMTEDKGCCERLDIQMIRERCTETMDRESVYQSLEYSGFTYGSTFATIEYALKGKSENLTKLKVGTRLQEEMKHTVIHPAILDGMLQSAAATDVQEKEFLPVELKKVIVYRPMESEMFVLTRMTEWTDSHCSFTLTLLSSNGTVIAEIKSFRTKFIGSESFDEQNATFKTGLVKLDVRHETESNNGEGVIVFTDADLADLKMKYVVHGLNHMVVDGTRSQLDSVLHEVSLICFIFPLSHIQDVTGDGLQDDLVKRVMSLRLIILYLANRMASVPLVIISELGKLENGGGRECAGRCLHEATKGFVRCVLREYRSLSVQLVGVELDDPETFVNRLPDIITAVRSEDMMMYPEIKFHNDEISMHTILPYTHSTPSYRTVLMDDTMEAVLCSTSKRSVADPFFYPKHDRLVQIKDVIKVTLTTVTIHDPFLIPVTFNMEARGTDSDVHPMLCLESVGEMETKSGQGSSLEIITCFPTEVCQKVKIPKSCTIPKSTFPDYTSGHLTKLYAMWSLCRNIGRNHIALLHTRITSSFARALSCMLVSLGARSVSFITPDEIETGSFDHCVSMMSTILITKDMTKKILKHCGNLKVMTCYEQISNQEVLESLLWSKPSLRIDIVRGDVFSQQTMIHEVPKLLKWIRSHRQTVTKITNHIQGFQMEHPSHHLPINISEVLQNTEMAVNPDDINRNHMKTTSTQLFKKRGVYLVVGGLTGLGWECVLYLISRGAGCVVTLSRSKPSVDRQNDMDILSRKYNCQVRSLQADVTVFGEVETTLFQMCRLFPNMPLKGVFFGAAVLVDATLVEMTEDKLRRSLSPKVTGVWNVHILTSHLPLDFFVLHSSGAAVLGNAGQSNYGAGNGFMDGLAHSRRHCGMSGQSINWGPLNLGMLDNKGSVLKRLQGQGYLVIGKKDINRCLTHMLMLNEPQTLLCRIDRQKMAEQLIRDKETTLLTRLKTYLEPAMKSIENKDGSSCGTRQTLSCERLKFCSREEGLHILQDYVKYLVCDKALLDESSFEMEVNMKDQGVDSMYAMEITGQILSDTGVKMSAHEIQLQSACIIAQSLLKNILDDETTEICNTNTTEKIISKQTITASIVKSICGFSHKSEFHMGFVIVSTIQLPDVTDIQTVVELAEECLSRHSITRSIWSFETNSVTKEELPVDKALDFRIISGCEAAEVKSHTEEPIQLAVHAPLRFILLANTLQLRMVFHKFAFDLKAITTFVKEFESLANAKQRGISLGDVHTDPDRDIAEEIQKVLAPHFHSLSQFWKLKTTHMPYNSFRGVSVSHHEQQDIFLSRKLDKETYHRILNFSRDQCLTAFDFFMGIFQFLLAAASNKSSSVVTISVDLRAHVPVLAKSLGRCTNFIPLICHLPENSATVEEFLQRNKMDIERFTKQGLLPSEEIKKGILDDQIANLERNYFIFEDDVMTSEINQLKVEMPVVFTPNTETFFYVWQRKATKMFEIRFHLRKDLFTRSRAEAVVDAFVGLVDDVLKHPGFTLCQLMRQDYMLMEEKMATSQRRKSSVCSII